MFRLHIIYFVLLLSCSVNGFSLPTISLLSPVNGEGISNLKPTFNWHAEGAGTIGSTVYINTTPNVFSGGTAYPMNTSTSLTLTQELSAGKIYYWAVEVVDNDGTTRSVVQSFSICKPNQVASFTTNRLVGSNITTISDVYAADMDQDSDMDIVGISHDAGKVIWFENDGNENFTEHLISSTIKNPNAVYVTDIDQDGDMDVVSCSWEDDKIYWHKNYGDQTFSDHIVNTTPAQGVWDVFAIDVNGDGDMDILSSSTLDNQIRWYENDGWENFKENIIYSFASGATGIYAIDMDKDGDVDVLSASQNDDQIRWYENNGQEVFSAHTITSIADAALGVFAIDMDDDGDIDVLSTSMNDDKVRWYKNDGAQNFTSFEINSQSDWAWGIYAADLDGDGDKDVLSTSVNEGKILWYKNDGLENFTTNTLTDTAGLVISVYAADIDSDGDMDILSSFVSNNEIRWFENKASYVPQVDDTLTYIIDTTAIIGSIDTGYIDKVYYSNNIVTLVWKIFLKNNDSLYITTVHDDLYKTGKYLVVLTIRTPIDTITISDILVVNNFLAIEDDLENTSVFTAYPNPSTNTLHVVFNTTYVGEIDLSILDATGQVIQQRSYLKTTSDFKATLDVSMFPAGLYLIHIHFANNERTLYRFLKQ